MSEIRVDSITDEAGTGAPEITDHYKKSNILGTVSESSGVPTGAIIESGSNANGEFVKYADGTMICITAKSQFLTTDNNVGNLYRSSGAATLDYPATFASLDYLSAFKVETGNTGGLDFFSLGSSNKDYLTGSFLSTVTPLFLTGGRSGDSAKVKVMAVGRWY